MDKISNKTKKLLEKSALDLLKINECPICKSKGIEVYDYKKAYDFINSYEYNLRCKVCKKFFGRYNSENEKLY